MLFQLCIVKALKDAAKRCRARFRKKRKRQRAIPASYSFCCVDLGTNVPGRLRSIDDRKLQKFPTWSLQDERKGEIGEPIFRLTPGGGIEQSDRFDVVSVQFALHYMMRSRERARRFFRTVSALLEIGGYLVVTTVDARVVLSHLMNLGLDLHFDHKDTALSEKVFISIGDACQLTFEPEIVKKIFQSNDGENLSSSAFGLEYTFRLVEGSNHSAGVGNAVDLPEWLAPLPILEELAQEVGLELEYAENFHGIFGAHSNPSKEPAAYKRLYKMNVLNHQGTISDTEWEISGMYIALKFRKERDLA